MCTRIWCECVQSRARPARGCVRGSDESRGSASPPPGRQCRTADADAVDRVTVDRRIDRAARRHHAAHQGLVTAMNLARLEHAHQASVRRADCARRPADRSYPCRACARCRRAAGSPAPNRGRGARSAASGRVCRRRDVRRAGRLVDDEQVRVLVTKVQRHRLRRRLGVRRHRCADDDRLPTLNPVSATAG